MFWWMDEAKPEPELDRDRKVTLIVGQLTDALAEALKVVADAPSEPKWKKGDRAYVKVEVTGTHGINGEHVDFVFAGRPARISGRSLPSNLLKEIA